jgi:hypothetical protein
VSAFCRHDRELSECDELRCLRARLRGTRRIRGQRVSGLWMSLAGWMNRMADLTRCRKLKAERGSRSRVERLGGFSFARGYPRPSPLFATAQTKPRCLGITLRVLDHIIPLNADATHQRTAGSLVNTTGQQRKTLFLNGEEVDAIETTGDQAKDLAAARKFLAEKGIEGQQERFALRAKIVRAWRRRFL